MSALSPRELRDLRERLGFSQGELADWLAVSRRTIQRWENGDTAPNHATVLVLRRAAGRSGSLGIDAPSSSDFTFIDLFAGIGGMRIGFEANGGRCIYTSEWDRFCRQTYTANFPTTHAITGDIRDVGTSDIPSHNLLLAGFPCQPFSVAGVSKKNSLGRPHGFADETQGTLFFDIARILRDRRPTAFLLENVKHLRGHDQGRTMDVILRTLEDELGYVVTTRVIDAKSFLPQHRERIFIAGFAEDTGFSLEALELPDSTRGPKLESVLHSEDGTEEAEPPFTEGELAAVSGKYTLSDHLWSYLQEYARKHRSRGNGFGFGLVGPADTARTLSARYYKDGSEILIRQNGSNPRRLTPRECARLMGFDGPGQNEFEIPVSDTQAYKQFGNAVAVPVVSAIAAAMAPHIVSLATTSDQLEFMPRLQTA
ncbi:DNA (cytosine-5-)-methyltransferase [Candidatus Palauibacter polyketidifaciens]|uniref:DNA (cytosine-5-)-methyltransferase n=1 Tax=Candidatus Palauibacter polyketidifaciens TaxID=3056740 RepID=UPI002384EA33|nr:DNA (cytosine-5-)-methyltransferase [Candidatus Palauibacter polyketidifaciens]MDE2719531.1 DNA (cytosine-5-)-methyltransferase [Candidatus Palauibacter polyketidifaciens]